MDINQFYWILVYVIALYGVASLNLPKYSTFSDSVETVVRDSVGLDTFKTLNFNEVAHKIEINSKSKYIAIEIMTQKFDRLRADFYNIIILFLPFFITMYLSYKTESWFLISLAVIHLALSADTYRVFATYTDSMAQGLSKNEAIEKAVGYERFEYFKEKKIDMFLETWVISAILTILFVAGVQNYDRIMVFN